MDIETTTATPTAGPPWAPPPTDPPDVGAVEQHVCDARRSVPGAGSAENGTSGLAGSGTPGQTTDGGGASAPAGAGGGAPVLGELADTLDAVDRLTGRVVALVARASKAGAAERDAGVTLDLWLSQVGRAVKRERHALLQAADTLGFMPRTAQALAEGRLSWSQVEAVVAAARRLSAARKEQLDSWIADRTDEFTRYEPDELVWRVFELVDEWRPGPTERAEKAAERDEFVALMPNLLGGGALYGQWGPEAFTTIADALDDPSPPRDGNDGREGRDGDDGDDGGEGDAADRDGALTDAEASRRALLRRRGKARAGRLAGWARHHLAGCRKADEISKGGGGDNDADRGRRPAPQPPHSARRGAPRPSLLLLANADSLLDASQTPGWLLTALAGGRMKVSAAYARRLIAERGCDLRTVVLDEVGEVVGVGRRTRKPPGWLRDAIVARDRGDTAPGSDTAARLCDLDHVQSWESGGPTDVDNLSLVGRRMHTHKTEGRWEATRSRDGTITWRHRRTGFAVARPPTGRRLDQPPAGDHAPPDHPPPWALSGAGDPALPDSEWLADSRDPPPD